MEELSIYLRYVGIDIKLQLVYENQRIEGGPPDVLESLMINLNAPWITPPKFIPTMKKSDPEHYTTSTGEPISFLKDVELPIHYLILRDWKAEVIPNLTDSEGWEYNRDFIPIGWVPGMNVECQVRRRKWFRIDVAHHQILTARQIASDFTNKLSLLRSFNPYMISNCFASKPYRLQYILECQRSAGGYESFSSIHLKSTDPFVWSIAHSDHCFIDPTGPGVSQLYNAHHVLYSNPCGADSLHEFIFSLYPNKDANGWEYNTDFFVSKPWSSDYSPNMLVRRRLWFRTITPPKLLYPYRSIFSRYVQLHPRGEIKKGEIQYYFRKKWNYGLMILTDQNLFVYSLENENVPEMEFKLEGTEIVAISRETNSASLVDEFLPRTHSITSVTSLLSALTDNSKLFLFTLNQIGIRGKDMGAAALFNASSSEDLEDWLCAITHQTALVHPIFWPIRFGPPLVDTLILEGDLWKKGNIIPNWTVRRFELRQDGTLAYYRNQDLRGKIRLRGCLVREGLDDTTIEINKNNGQSFVMKTMTNTPGGNEITRQQWIIALKQYTNQDKKVLDDTLVDDEPVARQTEEIISASIDSNTIKQSRKARLANVSQKRNLYIRESESPYLPQGGFDSIPEKKGKNELDLDLDQPFLETCEEYSDSYSDEDEYMSHDGDDDKGDNEQEISSKDVKIPEIDILDDTDLYADTPPVLEEKLSERKSESQTSQSHRPLSTKSSTNTSHQTTLKSSHSHSSHHHSTSSHHHHKPVEPVEYSKSISSTLHEDIKGPVPTQIYIPPSSSAGFSSYEEYVAARKKGADSNPYFIPQSVEEENPYSSYTEDPSSTIPYSSDTGSEYIPYTPGNSSNPYIPS